MAAYRELGDRTRSSLTFNSVFSGPLSLMGHGCAGTTGTCEQQTNVHLQVCEHQPLPVDHSSAMSTLRLLSDRIYN